MIAEKKTQGREASSRPLEHELDVTSASVLRGAASLRLLRDRVQALVKELDRLREKNQELANRIAELQSPQKENPKTTTLTFEKDREKLLAQINAFIKAIDDYLAMEGEQEKTDS